MKKVKTEQYCPKCGFRIDPHDRFCLSCGDRLVRKEEPFPLSDAEVKDIPIVEKSPIDKVKEEKGMVKTRDSWLADIAYLALGVIGLTFILVLMKIVHPVFFPLAIFVSLLAISLFGALNIRFDPANQDKQFLNLMLLALSKFFLFVWKEDKPK